MSGRFYAIPAVVFSLLLPGTCARPRHPFHGRFELGIELLDEVRSSFLPGYPSVRSRVYLVRVNPYDDPSRPAILAALSMEPLPRDLVLILGTTESGRNVRVFPTERWIGPPHTAIFRLAPLQSHPPLQSPAPPHQSPTPLQSPVPPHRSNDPQDPLRWALLRSAGSGALLAFTSVHPASVHLTRQAPPSGIWPVRRQWSEAYELLYSAWISRLFSPSSSDDKRKSYRPLHQVTRDPRRNLLFNALGMGEDMPGKKRVTDAKVIAAKIASNMSTKVASKVVSKMSAKMSSKVASNMSAKAARVVLRGDCGDVPYMLRAYFSWKLGLAMRFRKCTRGDGRDGPRCYEHRDNLTARFDAWKDSVERFNVFARKHIAWGVHSGNTRTLPGDDESAFYPIRIDRQTLIPGAVYVDSGGHLLVVTRVEHGTRQGHVSLTTEKGTQTQHRHGSQAGHGGTRPEHRAEPAQGEITAIDGHPDMTITTRRFSQPKFFPVYSRLRTGGFKRFRPVTYSNGRIESIPNKAIGNRFSEEQYELGSKKRYYQFVRDRLILDIGPDDQTPPTSL